MKPEAPDLSRRLALSIPEAAAVLGAQGPLHLDCRVHQFLYGGFEAVPLVAVAHVGHERGVDVAVPHVTEGYQCC